MESIKTLLLAVVLFVLVVLLIFMLMTANRTVPQKPKAHAAGGGKPSSPASATPQVRKERSDVEKRPVSVPQTAEKEQEAERKPSVKPEVKADEEGDDMPVYDSTAIYGSDMTRQFWADYNNLTRLPEKRKVFILKTLLDNGMITRDSYAILLSLKEGESVPDIDTGKNLEFEPEKQEKKVATPPVTKTEKASKAEPTLFAEPAEFSPSDFDSDDWGEF